MTPATSRRLVLTLAATPVVVVMSVQYGNAAGAPLGTILSLLLVAGSFLATGFLAWTRRPGNRMGPMMVALALCLLLIVFAQPVWPLIVPLGLAGFTLASALLGSLILAYPTGELRSTANRALVALAALFTGGPRLIQLLASDPAGQGAGYDNPYLLIHDPGVAKAMTTVPYLLDIVVLVAFVVFVAARWLGASGLTRRALSPALPPRMSVVAVCTVLGLASVAVADAGSRNGNAAAYAFFWIGLLLIFVPTALAVLRKDADRRERMISLILLGVVLYLVKVLASPDAFALTDEFIHLRNTQDILRTGHLFEFNPLLPTAAYYPGLAALTAGFVDLTGLSPFVSGILMIGAARILFCGCFFLVAERVTGSGRVAAAASLVYVANPMFLFWGSAFAYENLALPLAAFVVWWLGRTRHEMNRPAQIVTAIAIVAVIVTHHVVGFALTALLGAWWLAERIVQRGAAIPVRSARVARNSLGFMTIGAGTASLAWFLLVARPAPSYLFTYNILPALQQTVAVLLGQIPARRLYESGGLASPAWEPVAGLAAVGLLLLALPPALYRAWHRRAHAPMVVAVGVAAAYPLSLAARLAPNGVAISGRSSEYVFAGLACVVALLAGVRWWRRSPGEYRAPRAAPVEWHRTVITAGLLTVVFVGNVTIGTAFYQRLPETSDPHGYPWSVQADVISASEWARQHLGIHQRFGANTIDASALATYGEQDPVTSNDAWPIFFAEEIDASVVHQIRTAGVRYLLVDWRMTASVPGTPGYYFSPQEPHAGEYTQSFPAAALQKFASAACSTLIYDAKPVEIFDVSRIEDGSCLP